MHRARARGREGDYCGTLLERLQMIANMKCYFQAFGFDLHTPLLLAR